MAGVAWLLVQWPWALLSLMALAAITDLLDGYIARRMGLSGRGAWLDPLCDKTFVLSVVAASWWFLQPPWHVLAVIALRELLQILLMLAVLISGRRRHFNYRAAFLGKAATVAQFVALAVLLFGGYAEPWAWLAAAIGLLAVFQYAWRAAAMLRGAE